MLATEITVCLGSNVKECHHEMTLALEWLSKQVETTGIHYTQPYFTEPEGSCAGCPHYLNAVFAGDTTMTADELTKLFKQYEHARGRLPEHKKQGRIIIDIDLVCYAGEVFNDTEFRSDYFQQGYRRLQMDREKSVGHHHSLQSNPERNP